MYEVKVMSGTVWQVDKVEAATCRVEGGSLVFYTAADRMQSVVVAYAPGAWLSVKRVK